MNGVTRFEVVDGSGRAYVANPCRVELSYQDDGRTLKVFVSPVPACDDFQYPAGERVTVYRCGRCGHRRQDHEQ